MPAWPGADPLDPDDHALWHAVMATNLHGAYYCAKAALPLLPDGTGRIVTIASVLGLRGVPDQAPYVAAKHGVIGLTRALALAAAPRGITVNARLSRLGGHRDGGGALRRARHHAAPRRRGRAHRPHGDARAGRRSGRLPAAARGSGSLTGLALPIDGGSLALP